MLCVHQTYWFLWKCIDVPAVLVHLYTCCLRNQLQEHLIFKSKSQHNFGPLKMSVAMNFTIVDKHKCQNPRIYNLKEKEKTCKYDEKVC